MVGSIVEVSVLTHCALVHYVHDLKTTQMNVQHSLIQKLFLGSIMVVGELTHCALLQPLCKWRATQVNVQHSLIQKLFLGSIMVVGELTHCALLQPLCKLKPTQMNVQHSLIQEYMLLGHNTTKATKNICSIKGEGKLTLIYQICSRNFMRVVKILLIKQGQVGLILWILRLCFKPWKQIQGVPLEEIEASSASHSPVWFIIFTISAKASGAAKLFLTLSKYCNTFSSP